jgi:hypothetical protein
MAGRELPEMTLKMIPTPVYLKVTEEIEMRLVEEQHAPALFKI